ncbi:MAG: membrane protein insertion efficiency factor YidD [Ruminococcaceae bacterium]|nr:membrane protein insertion efficiency factor YidD [Oscillospiraceae bacterium]
MKKIFIYLIRLYQKHISSGTKRHCRFTPTCSQYAIEAINEWGAFRGFFLALYRILRCNPLCKYGYDPVPLRNKKKG